MYGLGTRTVPIGGEPGVGRPIGRVNPVGGVIGQAGSTHAAGMPMGALAGRTGDNQGQREVPLTFQWTAPSGVNPVIEPPIDRPHELGPGVIGVDK
jgi:hypothetical protein